MSSVGRGLGMLLMLGVLVPAGVQAKPPARWKPPARAVAPDRSPAPAASASESCGDVGPGATATLGLGPLALLDSAAVAIPILGSPTRGPATARVTLVEFSDFQCPSCRQAYGLLDSLARAFPRDLRIVYKHYPLTFHPHAFAAAEASLAAFDQGRFWEMAELMYGHQEELDQDAMMGWACELGLDVRAFSKGLYSGRFRSRVQLDMADGDRIGVRGTPMLYLNGHAYLGRRTLREVAPVVRALMGSDGSAAQREGAANSKASASGKR